LATVYCTTNFVISKNGSAQLGGLQPPASPARVPMYVKYIEAEATVIQL